MEPKYYAFRFGDCTPFSSSFDNMTIDSKGIERYAML